MQGIGESDFRMLRMKDYYFIDKTLFIKHILDNTSKVALITRSRSKIGSILNNDQNYRCNNILLY